MRSSALGSFSACPRWSPQLIHLIHRSDILGATQKIHEPLFPFLERWKHDREEEAGKRLFIDFQHRRLGSNFQDLTSSGLTAFAVSIFQAMANLTLEIDLHQHGVKTISDMELFIDNRNAIQHRLMSLQGGDELLSEEVSSPLIYESMRLVGIIYSAAVTFPMPPYQGIFRRLTSRLKPILEESRVDPCWQTDPNSLLWVLIIAGIAALDSEERNWYVQTLADVSRSLNLWDWSDVVTRMSPYLWLGSACGSGGRLLWSEVVCCMDLQR